MKFTYLQGTLNGLTWLQEYLQGTLNGLAWFQETSNGLCSAAHNCEWILLVA
jgi:hypothetical protein